MGRTDLFRVFRVRYTVGFLAHHLFNRRGHPESTSGFYTNKHQVLPIPFSSVVARTSNGSNCRSGFPVRRWSPSAVDDDSRCELRISSSVCAGVSVRREGVKGLQATCIFHVFQRQGRPPPAELKFLAVKAGLKAFSAAPKVCTGLGKTRSFFGRGLDWT